VSSHTIDEGKNVVGPAVRKLRYQRKLSQAQLAARCQLRGWNASRDIIAAIEGQIRYVTDKEIGRTSFMYPLTMLVSGLLFRV
jgi:transcriptional regulator with XRE-family HTH domain